MQQNFFSYYYYLQPWKIFYLIPAGHTETQPRSQTIFSSVFVFLLTWLWPHFIHKFIPSFRLPSRSTQNTVYTKKLTPLFVFLPTQLSVAHTQCSLLRFCSSPPDSDHTSHKNFSSAFLFLPARLWSHFTHKFCTRVCAPPDPILIILNRKISLLCFYSSSLDFDPTLHKNVLPRLYFSALDTYDTAYKNISYVFQFHLAGSYHIFLEKFVSVTAFLLTAHWRQLTIFLRFRALSHCTDETLRTNFSRVHVSPHSTQNTHPILPFLYSPLLNVCDFTHPFSLQNWSLYLPSTANYIFPATHTGFVLELGVLLPSLLQTLHCHCSPYVLLLPMSSFCALHPLPLFPVPTLPSIP